MSSFYDDASLVVIPSGYKTSKVYAEKPTDGSGDLTFTRTGDTATRVNSAGLIEKVLTNLALQSQTFDNASWTKSSATITANTSAAPDGTTTADTLVITIGGYLLQAFASFSAVTGSRVAISIYAKNQTNGFLAFGGATPAGTDVYSIQDVGNGWYRHSLLRTFTTTTTGTVQYIVNTVGTHIIWGAQFENDVTTPYIPTTTAAVSVGPVANVPRLDYLGSTCPRLLLEPQRTNLYNYSEQLNQWTASSATVTANYAVSPDGYTNADRVQFSAGGLLYIGGTGSAGENTLSVYAKATNGTSAKFRFFGNGNTTNSSDQTATGEWQRFTFTYTYSALTAGLKIATTGADDILFWGFQHEIGAYATSLIPTLAASATRGADACSKTGISSLIGQTEGTLFAEFNVLNINPANVSRIILSDGTTSNYIFLGINESGSGNLSRLFINNTAASFSLSLFSSTAITVGRHKLALAYKSGSFALYLDGNSVASSATTGTIPATSQLVIGGTTPTAASNLETLTLLQNILFPTRLTNAELAQLTTL